MADLVPLVTLGGAVAMLAGLVTWSVKRGTKQPAPPPEDPALVAARQSAELELGKARAADRRRARDQTLSERGWTMIDSTRGSRDVLTRSVELSWPDAELAPIGLTIPHARSRRPVHWLTIGPSRTATPGIGDAAFDADVATADPTFGGVSRALGWLDEAARTSVRRLVHAGWTCDGNGWQRRVAIDGGAPPADLEADIEQAVTLVAGLGEPPEVPAAAPIAVRALNDKSLGLRVRALEILDERWSAEPATRQVVADLIARPPKVGVERYAAIALLRHIPVAGAEAVLVAWLDDDEVRGVVVDALGVIGTVDAIPALRGYAGTDWAIRSIQERIDKTNLGGLSLVDPSDAGGLAITEERSS